MWVAAARRHSHLQIPTRDSTKPPSQSICQWIIQFKPRLEQANFGGGVTDETLQNIVISNGINDESKDIWFYSGEVKAAPSMTVTLTRPFAKLRLVATDYYKRVNYGLEISSFKITFDTPAFNKFNAKTGVFSGADGTTEYSSVVKTYSDEADYDNTIQKVFVTYIPVNNEALDAYYVSEAKTAEASIGLTLTRPYAKLCLVATDYAALQAAGGTLSDVTVTYGSGHFTTFGSQTGEFSAEGSTKEYKSDIDTYSADETATYTVGDKSDVKGKTIYAAYIPVNEEGTVDITFKVDDVERTVNSVPVKRNQLTTILGDFFTSDVELTLIIDENFESFTEKDITNVA